MSKTVSKIQHSRPWLVIGWGVLGTLNVLLITAYILQRMPGYSLTGLEDRMRTFFPLGMCVAAVCFIRERLKTGGTFPLIGVACTVLSFVGWFAWAFLMSSPHVIRTGYFPP